MIRNLAKLLLKNTKATNYLRRVYRESSLGSISAQTTVPEVNPLNCRRASINEPRLNLLVPSISLQHLFGGISTALSFFDQLSTDFENIRILLIDEPDFHYQDNPSFQDWGVSTLEDVDKPGKWIIPAGKRYECTLPVSAEDRFVATAWWTAFLVKQIQIWQGEEFHLPELIKFVYFIQDFEPCFYPWSSNYALAESTYYYRSDVIAIFNSSLLKEFFENENYNFPYSYFFEPKLNARLLDLRSLAMSQNRENRILVYGRPGTSRNAFEIIVMALRLWISQDSSSKEWAFVSAGEKHGAVDLGEGITLTSLGKLSLEDYAAELGKCKIGISLMISPHPSYPPLEMAAFGMQVITNKYRNKNLSQLSSNIFSLAEISPYQISRLISDLTDVNDIYLQNHTEKNVDWWNQYLSDETNFSDISQPIIKMLFDL